MGILLFAMGFGIQYLRFKGLKKKLFWRYLSLLIIFFLLLWAELAVGIFDSPLAGHWELLISLDTIYNPQAYF